MKSAPVVPVAPHHLQSCDRAFIGRKMPALQSGNNSLGIWLKTYAPDTYFRWQFKPNCEAQVFDEGVYMSKIRFMRLNTERKESRNLWWTSH